MNELTYRLLQELAEQLGTTTEYLWEVLVSQAPINSLTNIAMYVLWIVGVILIVRYWVRSTEDLWETENVVLITFYLLSGVWFVVGFFALLTSAHNTITGFLNPEYWALQQILELMK